MTSASDPLETKPSDDDRPAERVIEWLRGRPLPRDSHLVIGLFLPMILLAIGVWRVRAYTVDDAYISFRYARNLANGLGLVFNAGERIEGYSNFLFTCLLALAIKCGLDPERAAKILGAAAALGSIALTYAIAARLRPLRRAPVIATWLLAGSLPTAGWAVFGLETSLFVACVLLGAHLLLRERDAPSAFPWSGLALAAASLTRPEGPLFAALLFAFLARRRHAIRLLLFAAPVAAHLLFRRAYYGAWLPNTFAAKTGDLAAQIAGGAAYLRAYADHAGPFLLVAILGVAIAIARRRADLGAVTSIAIAVPVYVLLVGGDWMPAHRFLAPFEPFAFLLVDVAARALLESWRALEDRALARRPIAPASSRALRVAARVILGVPAIAFTLHTATSRGRAFTEGAQIIENDRRFWTSAAGGVAAWFEQHGRRGTIAVADMGFIAYATDYPILDLLGLVDPVISKLPGGYTHKTGVGYVERVFSVAPRYFVFVGSRDGCDDLPFESQARLRRDPRFRARYAVTARVRHTLDGYWCVFGPRDEASP